MHINNPWSTQCLQADKDVNTSTAHPLCPHLVPERKMTRRQSIGHFTSSPSSSTSTTTSASLSFWNPLRLFRMSRADDTGNGPIFNEIRRLGCDTVCGAQRIVHYYVTSPHTGDLHLQDTHRISRAWHVKAKDNKASHESCVFHLAPISPGSNLKEFFIRLERFPQPGSTEEQVETKDWTTSTFYVPASSASSHSARTSTSKGPNDTDDGNNIPLSPILPTHQTPVAPSPDSVSPNSTAPIGPFAVQQQASNRTPPSFKAIANTLGSSLDTGVTSQPSLSVGLASRVHSPSPSRGERGEKAKDSFRIEESWELITSTNDIRMVSYQFQQPFSLYQLLSLGACISEAIPTYQVMAWNCFCYSLLLLKGLSDLYDGTPMSTEEGKGSPLPGTALKGLFRLAFLDQEGFAQILPQARKEFEKGQEYTRRTLLMGSAVEEEKKEEKEVR